MAFTLLVPAGVPLFGGPILAGVFIASFDAPWWAADSVSGTAQAGVGPPFVPSVAFIVTGVVAAFLAQPSSCARTSPAVGTWVSPASFGVCALIP